jgi:repressor LexA
MSKNRLTKRQSEILEYIVAHVRDHGYPPSYREIADELGVSSTATIHEHVKNLELKGYLSSDNDGGRGIEVQPEVIRSARAIAVPLAGLITAGEPIEAIQEGETYDVPEALAPRPEDTYVLRVRGDSMIEDGIQSGDLVVVERNPAPKNGDIVVALLDNMYATLKRFYCEPGRVRLQPANSQLKPIYVKDVVVQGVVRGLVRDFSAA